MILLEVKLKASWSTLWGALTSGFPGLSTLLQMIALILVCISIIAWVWGRRKNVSAGDNKPLIGAAIVAILFAAPDVVLPFLLGIFDGIANFVLRLLQGIGS